MNQVQGGGSKVMSFGKSRAKRLSADSPKITFRDVAGVDEAVEELHEIKEFLENPKKFQALGARIPTGVLLYGPPGTGKTLLARAVAGEAGVPFFSISGSDFVEMFVGVGASRVRDLFEQAKQNSPCIIFMDEIDAVGRHRGAGLGGGHDEREQTLNQLLVEMDGFDIKDNVILIAATNRPDILDPALLRPGRFDRQVVVDRPDLKGRHAILKIHARGKPLAEDIDLEVIARRTPGFTGADLANLVNEGALLAARHGKKKVDMIELEEGIDRVVAGPERKSRLISEDEKKIIAFHEAGHAVVGHVLPHGESIHKVTIIPRGRSLGSTWHLPEEEKFLGSKQEMLANLASFMGGRVAEEIAIGDVTTGASNDIDRATKLAKQMVTQFGMSEKLGPQTFGEANHEVFLGRDFSANADYSPEVAYEIDKEVARLIDEAYEKARTILTENRSQLDLMASVLIERETIGKNELEALLNNRWDEYIANEKPSGDDEGDSGGTATASDEPAEEPAVAAEPPMAPGAPPAYNA
jgi:cell division protease FtsH